MPLPWVLGPGERHLWVRGRILRQRKPALSLNARLARRMPPDGTRVRVRTVRRYITAFEVCDEESI